MKKTMKLPPNSMEIEWHDAGLYLRTRILGMGYTVTDFAKAIGVGRQTLYQVLQGITPMSPKLLEKLNAIDPEFRLVQTGRIERK